MFSGRVQGVGFRYTAARMAQKFPVTGFVKNLSNGQVELMAEGEEKSLEDFLKAIKEAFQQYLRGVDTQWGETTGRYQGFKIEF